MYIIYRYLVGKLFFSICWESSSQLSHIFQRGRNQPPDKYTYTCFQSAWDVHWLNPWALDFVHMVGFN